MNPNTLDQRSASIFLTLLVCGDLAFVLLHLVNDSTTRLMNPLLSLEKDRGYAEMYQYLKFLWIILLLILVSLRKASWGYVLWASVFAYLLADDALQVHERVGMAIAENFGLAPALWLRPQDHGELAVSLAAGTILFAPLAWAYGTGTRAFRKSSLDLALLLGLLIFFGVGVDMAHVALGLGGPFDFAAGVIEEGGEMVAVSLILGYAFLIAMRDGDAHDHLFDSVRQFMAKR